MAYLMELEKPKCIVCHSRATVELFNRYNATMGKFCRSCGKKALEAAEKRGA